MNATKLLPKQVKFIKYHMRHCAVFDPKNTFPHIIDIHQSYRAEHADINIVWPEAKGRAWLAEHGYTPTGEGDMLKTGETWGKA
jgi:hypothetical protein